MEIILKYFDDFSDTQLRQMEQLQAIYTEWNEKINLISRKDIDNIYINHVLHSLSIAVVAQFLEGASVLDIGTGGGFPGIPLAIYFPNVSFTLVDSIAKKINAVNEIKDTLGLKNVTTHVGRVEEIKGKKFHFAVTRGVAPLSELWQWVDKKIEKGRMSEELRNGLLCLKGGAIENEIQETGMMKRIETWDIEDMFDEAYFKNKYVVHVRQLVTAYF